MPSNNVAGNRKARGCSAPPLPRVVFDGRYIQDRYHGIGRYAFNLVEELAALMPGTHFTVIREPGAPENRFDWSALAAHPNVAVRNLRASLFSVREQLALPLSIAADTKYRVPSTESSVVHPSQAQDPSSIVGRPSSVVYHSPYFALPWLFPSRARGIVTVHDCIFERDRRYMPRRWARLYFGLLMRASMSRSAFVAVPSRSTARDLRRFYHTPARKIIVTPEAADPTFRPICPGAQLDAIRGRYDLPEKFVMAVGARRPHKNFALLVRAVEQIEQATLVFVGEADERFHDEAAEAATPLGARVRFLGKVDEVDLPALYNLATVVACPSIIEGFGLPVLEAMACGTPVVCSAIPVFMEVAGDAAAYAPTSRAGAWAARLGEVLDNPARQEQLRHSGLARSAQFTWRRAAEALAPVYSALGLTAPVSQGL